MVARVPPLVVKRDTVLAINGIPLTDERQGRSLARAAVGKVAFSILREGSRFHHSRQARRDYATGRDNEEPPASVDPSCRDRRGRRRGCAASNLVIKGDTILVINGVQLTDEIHGRALWPGRQWAWSSSRFSAGERT